MNNARTCLLIIAFILSGSATLDAGETSTPSPKPGTWHEIHKDRKISRASFMRHLALPDGSLIYWWTRFDLKTGLYSRVVPKSKPDWAKAYPKLKKGRVRYVDHAYLNKVDGEVVPASLQYFNQNAYVPSEDTVYYLAGGRFFFLDLKSGSWSIIKTEKQPPWVIWGALEYDPVNKEIVLFGGNAQCDDNRPGTWLYSVEKKEWRKLEQPLSEQPPARCLAPMAYDSKNKLIAVFGGNAQSHYLTDTWTYDCTIRKWRELKTNIQPWPRKVPCLTYLGKHGVFLMGGAAASEEHGKDRGWTKKKYAQKLGRIGAETLVLDAAKATWTRVAGGFPNPSGGWNQPWSSLCYDRNSDRAIIHRVPGEKKMKASLHAWQPDLTPSEKTATPAPEKTAYIFFPPEWYTEGLQEPDPAAGEKLIQSLKPNAWTLVKPPRSARVRTWGTAALDTDRHEILYWGGGHCGYTGTDVSHFSLKTLRWTGSYPAEFSPPPEKPFYGMGVNRMVPTFSLGGRPWVPHARTAYAYDSLCKKMIVTQMLSNVPPFDQWTFAYDPVKRDFIRKFNHPFRGSSTFPTMMVPTPHGMICYTQRFGPNPPRDPAKAGVFRLDSEEMCWIQASSDKSVSNHEANRIVYDGRRDRLIMVHAGSGLAAFSFKQKPSKWQKLKVTGKAPGWVRESVYVNKHDVILSQGGAWVCKLSEGNAWEKTGIKAQRTGWNSAVLYDPKLDVLVRLDGNSSAGVQVRVMRYVPVKNKESAAPDPDGEKGK